MSSDQFADVGGGITLCYETIGDAADPPLLLVMGLGAQLVEWDEEFCAALASRGFYVIRFDNRDCGLSTKSDALADVGTAFMRALAGEPVEAPYLLADMANDAAGLLDALGIDSAHVVGVSMGGMIAQTLAITYPARVRSLTSIMSTTGDSDVGQPHQEALNRLLMPPAADRDSAIAQSIETWKVIGSPDDFDEERRRQKAATAYDRCFHPPGTAVQLLAIVASGSRSEALGRIDMPALVIHGDADPLVDPSGGERTAEVIPGAELLMLEGMGHDLPPVHWTPIIEAIVKVAARAN